MTALDNIFHCCVQKTGSQWIRTILSDKRVVEATGLSPYYYYRQLAGGVDERILTKRVFETPLPRGTIVTPLYLCYHSYNTLPKPPRYRTLYIYRDPRDLLVSWYYSTRDTHPLMGGVAVHRQKLHELSMEDGLIYGIKFMYAYGFYDALQSWHDFSEQDEWVLALRFEDLVRRENQSTLFRRVFTHCKIDLNEKTLRQILDQYDFEKMRQRSMKDGKSHYRRGQPGEWRDVFTPPVMEYFLSVAGGLPETLGYDAP